MPTIEANDVTKLLEAFGAGERDALNRLMPRVYRELRFLAHRALCRERGNHTLGTTALVHEAYLRLADQRHVDWRNRAQFFAIAARMMRRILVDYARGRVAAKRGAGQIKAPLQDAVTTAAEGGVDLVGLDEAVSRLSEFAPRQGRTVELRFFGGLSIEETAEVLGISPATVKREWATAKAWLRRELMIA